MIEKQSSKETALRRKDYLQELQAIEDERRILSAEKETLAEKLVEKKKILADWLTSNYLRKDLSPMIVFETIALIQSTKDLIAKVHNSLAKMTAVNQNIGEYEQQLMELTNGKKHFSGKTVEAVYWLNEQLKHNQALSSRLINIQGQLMKKTRLPKGSILRIANFKSFCSMPSLRIKKISIDRPSVMLIS